MTYSLEFDYAAITICLLLMYLYFVRPRFRDAADFAFILMVITLLVATVLDVITAMIFENPGVISDGVDYPINIIFLLVTGALPIPCFIYVSILTTGDPPGIRSYLVLIAVGLLTALFIVTTPITHWVFSVDGGIYAHGPYFDLLYLLPIFYLSFFLRLLVRKGTKLTSAQGFAVGFFMLGTITAIAVQAAYPFILLMSFVIAVFVTLMYLTAQNPDEYVEGPTGCYNAAAFKRVMEGETRARASGYIVACSLRDFNYLSQTYGASIGDAVIGAMGVFLTGNFGQRNVFRLLDCDYAIKVHDESEARGAVDTIADYCHGTVNINGLDFSFNPYFCIIPYPDAIAAGDDIPNTISYYLSRPITSNARHVITADSTYLDAKLREGAVNQAIQLAISQESFKPFFQPIYNHRKRRVDSAEVLIRLDDPQLGSIGPDEFITLAERNGSVAEIDGILFEKVLSFIRESQIEHYGIEYLECNLSTVECAECGFPEHVLELMGRYDVPPQMISFEITETASSISDDVLRHMMDVLIAAHSSFALDDYGTGFASSSYLLKYRFKLIKLDKVLLYEALENEGALKILEYSINLLEELGYQIVAEGVETKEQFDLLIRLGVERMQGYYISRPMDQDAFLGRVKEWWQAGEWIPGV